MNQFNHEQFKLLELPSSLLCGKIYIFKEEIYLTELDDNQA